MSVIPVCLSEYNYIDFIVLKADGFVLLDSSFWFYWDCLWSAPQLFKKFKKIIVIRGKLLFSRSPCVPDGDGEIIATRVLSINGQGPCTETLSVDRKIGDKHDWKYYIPATSIASSEKHWNSYGTIYVPSLYLITCVFSGCFSAGCRAVPVRGERDD